MILLKPLQPHRPHPRHTSCQRSGEVAGNWRLIAMSDWPSLGGCPAIRSCSACPVRATIGLCAPLRLAARRPLLPRLHGGSAHTPAVNESGTPVATESATARCVHTRVAIDITHMRISAAGSAPPGVRTVVLIAECIPCRYSYSIVTYLLLRSKLQGVSKTFLIMPQFS